MVSVPDTSRVSPMVEPLSRPYRSNAKVLRARLQEQDRSDDLRHQPTDYALRLRLVPARVRVLEEQPDALAALLPGPVVARRREGQVAQDTLIQRPPDRPRCLYALGDDRLAVGSRADQSIRGRLLPIAQHFDRVRHARAVRECDPGVHGRVPAELTPEDRAGSRSEEHTSELQSPCNLVCRLLLEKKKKKNTGIHYHSFKVRT